MELDRKMCLLVDATWLADSVRYAGFLPSETSNNLLGTVARARFCAELSFPGFAEERGRLDLAAAVH